VQAPLLQHEEEKIKSMNITEEHEMKRPKLSMKQNYFEHIQKITKYTNG